MFLIGLSLKCTISRVEWHPLAGKRFVVFLQDTNALAFVALPSALGVSKVHELEVSQLLSTVVLTLCIHITARRSEMEVYRYCK